MEENRIYESEALTEGSSEMSLYTDVNGRCGFDRRKKECSAI